MQSGENFMISIYIKIQSYSTILLDQSEDLQNKISIVLLKSKLNHIL